MSELVIPGSSSGASNVMKRDESLTEIKMCGRKFFIPKTKNLSDFDIFYVGEQSKTLTYFMMSFNQCQFYSYYPFKKMLHAETLNVNKALRKRYYYIEKAKCAKLIGIIVRTVTVRDYDIIKDQLIELVENAGKRVFVLIFTKFSSTGLANYPCCDVYVDIACMESSLMENRELYQPMITPYELEIALNQARTWTGDYITDFSELLPEGVNFISCPQRKDVNADVSLVSGKIYTLGLSETDVQDDTASGLATRDEMKISAIHSRSAGEFLTQLSWQGLEQHLGETAVPKICEGRKGIASAYEDELNGENK
ncbi:Diphthamide biosynthesis protein 2, partial [Stegodyphus mimosarum]